MLAIAQPTALRWHVSSVPAWVGRRNGTPDVYLDLGRFAIGDAAAWLPPIDLVLADQLELVQLAAATRLGYTLAPTVAATVTELTGAGAAVPLDPVDRYIAPFVMGAEANVPGTVLDTSMHSYTVPAGQRLRLQSGRVWQSRNGVASTSNYCYIRAQLHGGLGLDLLLYSNALGTYQEQALQAPVDLFAGETLAVTYAASANGGNVVVGANWAGFRYAA